MNDRSCDEQEPPRHELGTVLSKTLTETVTPGISPSNYEFSGQVKQSEEYTGSFMDLSQHTPSSLPSTTHKSENEELVITSIRVMDVSIGLTPLPSWFCVVLRHSDHEWRTENKPWSAKEDFVEWGSQIPLPSDLSATVCLEVYASSESPPIFGAADQLRNLTVTVEKLLDYSAKDMPLTFVQKEEGSESPCSSVFVTVKRPEYNKNDSSLSKVLDPHCLRIASRGELEDVTNHGHSALSHYREHGEEQDLERSTEKSECALSDHPLGVSSRAAAQSNLTMAKSVLRQVGHTDTSPEQATEQNSTEIVAKQAVALTLYLRVKSGEDGTLLVDGPPSVDQILHTYSLRLIDRFTRYGDIADLQQAIAVLKKIVGSAPVSSDWYLLGVANLGMALRRRFLYVGGLTDLEDAISWLRVGVDLTPHGNPDYLVCLGNLANCLMTRFQRTEEPSDLELAILRYKDVVDLTPDGHPEKPNGLSNLGNALSIRFQHLGELRDLEEAISTHRNAVHLTPRSDPALPASQNNLGASLRVRFNRLGEPSDLEDAISRIRDAVDLTPHDHPYKPLFLTALGDCLLTRFERFGKLGDFDEAISNRKDAVKLTPPDHPEISDRLSIPGSSLLARFEHVGGLRDLEDAISTYKNAVDLTPHDHTDRPDRLNHLGNFYMTRFHCLGELIDLEEAIATFREAADLTRHGHPLKRVILDNLGTSFKVRFRRLREVADLKDAVSTLRSAVECYRRGDPDLPGCLNNFGNSLKARFDFFGNPSDLEEAVSAFKDAVELTPIDNSNKPDILNNLGNSLVARFRCLGELSDLEDALSRCRAAADLTPYDHPHRPGYLNSLGNAFIVRFKRLGQLDDLDDAIATLRDAVYLTSQSDPCFSIFLAGFGDSLLERFKRLGELKDLEGAISVYSQAATTSTSPTRDHFHASQIWISCARRIRHRSLLQAYSVAIRLLPQLAWIGLSLTHRYAELIRCAGMVQEAAAAALDVGLPETAVEWLEQGRLIVWGELFQLRSSYEELSSAHPAHSHRLQELSAALEHAGAMREQSWSTPSEPAPGAAQSSADLARRERDRHRMLAIQRDQLVQEIRGFPGFEKFPLRKDFSRLRASAHSGPVVILNAAESRCDALIVLADVDRVIHVPLPNFDFKRSTGVQKALGRLLGYARVIPSEERKGEPAPQRSVSWESLLSTLWNGVVKPVLDALALSTSVERTRIFWCPTGPFVFLPIHAAGLYDAQHSQPGHKVSDFVVSSYVPSLSILAPSSNPATEPSDDLHLLAVRQPATDGLSPLPGVATELDRLRATIQTSPPSHITLVESSLGTVEEVLELMKNADWVHFACHGVQDTVFPTDSGLCLADGRRLKLRDVIALARPHGGLAFLSACQTAMGNEELCDEALHIAAGMLFAGYGGVVGTLWSISDRVAPEVAGEVYAHLLREGKRPDYREAAVALHGAVERLRERGASFVEWVPFIHVGL